MMAAHPDLLFLVFLAGLTLAWYLIGVISVILLEVPQWYLGESAITLDADSLTFAWGGPLVALGGLIVGLVILVSFLLDLYPKVKSFRLPRLPESIVILKRRRIKGAPDQSTLL